MTDMAPAPLIDWIEGHRDGITFDPDRDLARLNTQAGVVFRLMCDGIWRTPDQMETVTGFNWSSINARLRDFRKPRFGNHSVERRSVGKGLHEYRLLVNREAA